MAGIIWGMAQTVAVSMDFQAVTIPNEDLVSNTLHFKLISGRRPSTLHQLLGSDTCTGIPIICSITIPIKSMDFLSAVLKTKILVKPIFLAYSTYDTVEKLWNLRI